MSGMGTMRLDDDEAPVRAGDCVVIAPGAVHKLWNPGTEPLVLLCCCAPAYSHEDTVLTGPERRAPPALRRVRGDRAVRPAVRGERRRSAGGGHRRADRRHVQRAPPGSSSGRATSATSSPGTRSTPLAARETDPTWRRRRTPARACCSASATRARATSGSARRCPRRAASGACSCASGPATRSSRTYLTWNEANHRGQPTWNRPKLRRPLLRHPAQQLPRRARSSGRQCSTRPRCRGWVRRVEKAAKHRIGVWALHNYIDANRFRTRGTRSLLRATKAKIWFTETGGLVRRDNGSRIEFAESPQARGEGHEVGAQARPPEPPRPARSTSTTGPRPRPRPPGTRR